MKQNPRLHTLPKTYLFAEIAQRVKEYKVKHPKRELLNLSIGDTSIPLPSLVTEKTAAYMHALSHADGYTGYQDEQGSEALRDAIGKTLYHGRINSSDIFISDGAKGDIGRLQVLFSHVQKVYVQDPTYPVYVDGTCLQTDAEIIRLPCTKENDFFIDVSAVEPHSLVYLCSPNNPTGSAATFQQLKTLVEHLKNVGSFLIFDSAYRFFAEDTVPRSIYEIPGAEQVAIEVSSFSKFAGFTGIRLGYTIVPSALTYADGTSVQTDFKRIHSTIFNGASILSQAAGLASLEDGYEACLSMVCAYKTNASVLKEALQSIGYTVFGGTHAPYLFIHNEGQSSQSLFDSFLETYGILGVPGIGFGQAGEGYLRFSCLFHPQSRDSITERLGTQVLADN